ncbi:MAG: AbrB/MazE/SpoVT family DNA-binding domain-containing protein [Candidatus Omnitrophica bacterium]|nr:AbrB/MazE/SpoVT family DNA-binding domain-containing protein [Candidatus Omnitrophota bacterium]
MIKTLTAHGNSQALVIEKAILQLLNIDVQTPLEVTTDGMNIIVSPVRSKAREKAFRSALKNTNKKHAKTLRKLAE